MLNRGWGAGPTVRWPVPAGCLRSQFVLCKHKKVFCLQFMRVPGACGTCSGQCASRRGPRAAYPVFPVSAVRASLAVRGCPSSVLSGKGNSLKRFLLRFAATGCLVSSASLADTVSLANGDRLSGTGRVGADGQRAQPRHPGECRLRRGAGGGQVHHRHGADLQTGLHTLKPDRAIVQTIFLRLES